MHAVALIVLGAFATTTSAQFNGIATTYGPPNGESPHGGNCALMTWLDFAPQFHVALNDKQWSSGVHCGRCVQVQCTDARCKNPQPVLGQITDRCPECNHGDLDMSLPMFNKITGYTTDRLTIHWEFVDCPVSGGVQVCAKAGSSKHWLYIQASNTVDGVASMNINGAPAPVFGSAYYFMSQVLGSVELADTQISMTSHAGETIQIKVTLEADKCTQIPQQFSKTSRAIALPAAPPSAEAAPTSPPTTQPTTSSPPPTTTAPIATTSLPTTTTFPLTLPPPTTTANPTVAVENVSVTSAAPTTTSPTVLPTTVTATTSAPTPSPTTSVPEISTAAPSTSTTPQVTTTAAPLPTVNALKVESTNSSATTSSSSIGNASATESSVDDTADSVPEEATTPPTTTPKAVQPNEVSVKSSRSGSAGSNIATIAFAGVCAVGMVVLAVLAIRARNRLREEKRIQRESDEISIRAMSEMHIMGSSKRPKHDIAIL
ncbi:hypothetical protein AC1031_001211 [Aphanomyces cochlioides]|nr:hypothetical protein AC1031_001211 [Aphanomyces cochlioides]